MQHMQAALLTPLSYPALSTPALFGLLLQLLMNELDINVHETYLTCHFISWYVNHLCSLPHATVVVYLRMLHSNVCAARTLQLVCVYSLCTVMLSVPYNQFSTICVCTVRDASWAVTSCLPQIFFSNGDLESDGDEDEEDIKKDS
jgi:hypothetical protein